MMMKKKRVLVIGHRAPDSDAVCSAIGYAYFKNHIDKTRLYVPCRAGALNEETSFVLERFNLETPLRVDSVAATVEDMDIKKPISVSPEQTMMDIGYLIKDRNIQSFPVVDTENRLIGIVDKMDLAVHYVERLEIENLSAIPVDLSHLMSALRGKILANTGKMKALQGEIFVAASQRGTTINRAKRGDIAILGDRNDVQMDLIKAGCSALIITGDHPVSKEVLQLARKKRVLVISSPHRTFATARLINLCMPVSQLMSKTVPTVELTSTINEVKEKVLESKYRCVMIVDDDNHLIGVITRSDLLEPIQKQVVLVDHNEISQAVNGIEDADILEIIDHHRVGDISTIRPITVYNEPIGSTCTIIASQIFLHRIEMIPDIAGALLSGILSDTLLLTLSTTTEKDREIAQKLAGVAELDLTTFGKELLASSMNIQGKSPREILFHDFKTYHFDGKKIGVNQIMSIDNEEIAAVESDIKVEMERLCRGEAYDLVAMMIMNPLEKKGEDLIVKGDKKIIEKAFGVTVKNDKCFIPTIMSRKKDFIPRIGRFLTS
ncbi:MAG: putative manganese-dependent inorganic diphosphatase [Deltaproteobacteria bacterium]|nr:putative manganese-dependent inorganic diphosphatase [Deltaproteobacteria bacterium]MBW2019733.1 putative manganese-dependent inorganic diphosphatase [Deltaproteobacteria bacterium]MBW2073934.1 putative manganese-dependent inorganic diphosphatase [Deltaproteobacteria bacterium]